MTVIPASVSHSGDFEVCLASDNFRGDGAARNFNLLLMGFGISEYFLYWSLILPALKEASQ